MTTKEVATIGYQGATIASVVDSLRKARVELLVDVRAVASSRLPGFSKTRLAANVGEAGIDYLHLRGLGTPADGRAAARSGNPEKMHAIFRDHLTTPVAQTDLQTLVGVIESGRRVCLLCFEADPAECHRSLVADALKVQIPLKIKHLRPGSSDDS